eukprot:jgi/Botrbrau1/19372/Bobra.0338s0006.1
MFVASWQRLSTWTSPIARSIFHLPGSPTATSGTWAHHFETGSIGKVISDQGWRALWARFS